MRTIVRAHFEVELQRRVCHDLLPQAEAQREVAAAYARYVGGVPVAAPDPGPVATAALAARPTVRARLRAAALRLARRLIFDAE